MCWNRLQQYDKLLSLHNLGVTNENQKNEHLHDCINARNYNSSHIGLLF